MADEDRSSAPNSVSPNRTQMPGLGAGQKDNPQEDWGEAIEVGAVHSSNHTRRPVRTEAERGQGAKTRRMTKDIISRRAP